MKKFLRLVIKAIFPVLIPLLSFSVFGCIDPMRSTNDSLKVTAVKIDGKLVEVESLFVPQTSISLMPTVVITFSHSISTVVSALSVSLKDETEETVSLSYELSDEKKTLTVAPTKDLHRGTAYILLLSKALASSEAKELGKDVVITFATIEKSKGADIIDLVVNIAEVEHRVAFSGTAFTSIDIPFLDTSPTSVTLTTLTLSENATAKVEMNPVTQGSIVPLSGSTLVLDVIAEDGVTTKTYIVSINVKGGYILTSFIRHSDNKEEIFSKRESHTALTFGNQLWVIGGFGDPLYKNDVWKSFDGSLWTKVKASTSVFSPRFGHTSVVFKDQIWVIGGSEGRSSYKNDIWKSIDGSTWVQVTQSAPFIARSYLQAVVFRDSLWVIGGSASDVDLNDVWKSGDGNTWDQVRTSTNIFSARHGHQAVVFRDSLWVIGGSASDVNLNDVWKSGDGNTWTASSTTNSFPARRYHQSLVFNNQLWVFGGLGSESLNDVWTSMDGKVWTRIASANFTARYHHRSTVFANKIFVMGGTPSLITTSFNEVRSTGDGIDWGEVPFTPTVFTSRSRHKTVAYNGKIWLIGGFDVVNRNDVWSFNGSSWAKEADASFFGRKGHQALVYNNKLWILGGSDDANYWNDVWSFNGVAWVKEIDAGFSGREGHQAVVYQNKIWVIGGMNGSNYMNDVWSFDNGTWKREVDAGFSARAGHQAVVYQNKIWVIGGRNNNGISQKDIYNFDGRTWTKVNPSTTYFSERGSHKVLVVGDAMYVIGGYNSTGGTTEVFNDVWRSKDGSAWENVILSPVFEARSDFGAAVFQSKIWIFGGLGETENYNDVWSSNEP